MNRKKILGLLITVAAISIPLHAATLYVDTANSSCDDQGPGTAQLPFCSIQAGYDTTADGDELRVMPGTYVECLYLYDWGTQKGVSVVADAYVNSGDNDSTIIDGTGLNCVVPDTTNPASVVNMGGFGGKLEGFTVTGASLSGIWGVGPVIITNNVVTGNGSTSEGGGIFLYASPCYYGDVVAEVSNNEITGNTAAAGGGGISVVSGQLDTTGCSDTGNATVTIDGNVITGNTADGSGGGILAATFTVVNTNSAEIVITSNTISGNGASSDESIGWGGGIFGYTFGYGTESIEVRSNTIAGNTTLDSGGGASMWIDPLANDSSIDHEIVVADNTVTGNQGGLGGGGLDILVRAVDFRTNQRADMHVYGNAITGNTLTGDLPIQTFGGGGILVYNVSENSNSPRIGLLLEDNDISNNAAFVFGGGVSVASQAFADPGSVGTNVNAGIELRNNAITRNNASTDVQGWDGTGGGVFILLETEGDALSQVDMTLNTIADNTIDTINEVGGIHAESWIRTDTAQNEGAAAMTLNSSIVAGNDGVGFGGPSTGLPGYITPEGGDNFVVTMTYTDLHGNEAGDLDSWVPTVGAGNIFEDPLLTPVTYIPQPCSPTIDSADPSFDASLEPQPNGEVANMGHTGGTSAAAVGLAAIDINGDGHVDGIDILRIATSFASSLGQNHYSAAADLNRDDVVDGDDLAFVSSLFGETCE